MNPALEKLSDAEKKRLKKRKQPDWTGPLPAALTHRPFFDKGWIFERKLDGERCLAFRKGKNVTSEYVHSRSHNWLKFKSANRQEFVVGDFMEPKRSQTGFGPLLIGYFEGGYPLDLIGKQAYGFILLTTGKIN